MGNDRGCSLASVPSLSVSLLAWRAPLRGAPS